MKTSQPYSVLLLAVLSLGQAPGTALAATTTFRPAVVLEESHSDNVLFVSGAENPVADWVTRLGVELPLRTEGERSSLRLAYRPAFERYRELSALDHAEHRFSLEASTTPRRTSSFTFGLDYAKTQEQGVVGGLSSPDIFLASRTDRTLYSGAISWTTSAGPRWEWAASVRGGRSTYTAIEGFDPGLSTQTLEDRNEYEAAVTSSRLFSRETRCGLGYRFRRFDLATSGKEDVHTLSLALARSLGRAVSVTAHAGGFRRSQEAVPADDSGNGAPARGFEAGLGLRRDFRHAFITLGADRAPSSGGALRGTSTDTTASLVTGGEIERHSRWEVSARYARRDPSLAADPVLTTIGGAGTLEWFVSRRLGIRFGAARTTQSGNEVAALDGSFTTVRAGLTWYPLGPEDRERRAR
jgi:hypothetical protein